MITDINSEDRAVQQRFVEYLGQESMQGAIEKLNPDLPDSKDLRHPREAAQEIRKRRKFAG